MIINWNYSFILASGSEGFRLNPDILETNVINIILLLIILFFTAGKFLQDILSSRYEKILTSIQDSEQRLTEATERLAEIKFQWTQVKIIVREIENETKRTQNALLVTELNQVKIDLAERFNTILVMLQYRETQVFNNVIKQVASLALTKAITTLQDTLGETELILINESKINALYDLGDKL
jgi:F-type H+-transporting ATPase subunit b